MIRLKQRVADKEDYSEGTEIETQQPTMRVFVAQPQRWKIERTFGWLGWCRILSKEHERSTESSESNIYLASIRLMLRRLVYEPM